jgi:ABC-type cobalamin transport system permease subunit
MVETVGIRQVMWCVMLESAKDRVIGVDTPRQQVPPCVRCGTTCLLIRDVVGSVPCSDEWEIGVVTRLG